ncbi:hypothetical protein ACSSNL_05090 [Thalassobius sp. S69A]|uniref:hypothetical protein n=1 Tax=unclassified Thalassovita TaxID=2619711 RepID=UPI000C1080C4|nr:hypothetical protein [Paracoccaceae bacterium]MBT25863.1 hypothetical protein [Paracoccaceae bacterium]
MGRRHKLDELPQATQDRIKEELATGSRSMLAIGKQFGVSDTSVKRWWKKVPEDERLLIAARVRQSEHVAAVKEAAAAVSDGDDIDNDLRWLVRRLRSAIESCGDDDDKLLELAQMREMRNTLMDLAKVRGMFSQKIDVTVDLGTSPQFLLLRQIILRVLEAHPSAKADFLTEMQQLQVIEHQP